MFYLFCCEIILPFSKLHAVGEGLTTGGHFILYNFQNKLPLKKTEVRYCPFSTQQNIPPLPLTQPLKGSSIFRVILCPSAIFVPLYFASGTADRRDLAVSNESSRWNYGSHRGVKAWTPSPGDSSIETVDKREMIMCEVEPWASWYR